MHISNITAKWMQCPFSCFLYVVIQVDDLNDSTFASADVDGQRVYWKPQMTKRLTEKRQKQRRIQRYKLSVLVLRSIFISFCS